jgi:hypothetical protein
MTKLGALVQQLGPNKWLIAAGEQVPEFVFANGPAFVTHYNFNQTRGRKVDLKYLAINSHLPSRKSDMQDILTLTPAGVELSKRDPHAVVYEWEFACTGKSTTTAPNCHRTCCGGYGTCLEACGGRARRFYSSCGFRVTLTATLDQVAAGKVAIACWGTHVPEGVLALPPPPEGRRPNPEQLRGLIRKCLNNVNLSMCWGRCDMKTFAINDGLRRNFPSRFRFPVIAHRRHPVSMTVARPPRHRQTFSMTVFDSNRHRQKRR